MILVPVILSGGAGTRLWPVSRSSYPKPFMRLPDGESLALKTLKRAVAVSTNGQCLTVTSEAHFFNMRDEYAALANDDDTQQNFLLEPMGKNTAPAVLMAALQVADQQSPDAVMLVMPADHLIEDEAAFSRSVAKASQLAEDGYLVTFGVKPTRADTGFGYVKTDGELKVSGTFSVDRFVEKPNAEKAKDYVDSGDYYWNSGIFCFRADSVLAQFRALTPLLYEQGLACWEATSKGTEATRLPSALFAELESISIDFALMEHATSIALVAAEFDWNDIGSWAAVSELGEPDDFGNRVTGDAIVINSTDCFLQSEHKLIAAVGLENLVVVDTGDAVLVANRDQTQDVSMVVQKLRDSRHEAATSHQTVRRPWGSFSVLLEQPQYKVKRLVVKPGQVLSLQMHYRRSEHWTVVSGCATVIVGEREFDLNVNESTYVPVETRHRLENRQQEDVVIIEVQCGEYLGEDDIVRYEDIYGRAAS